MLDGAALARARARCPGTTTAATCVARMRVRARAARAGHRRLAATSTTRRCSTRSTTGSSPFSTASRAARSSRACRSPRRCARASATSASAASTSWRRRTSRARPARASASTISTTSRPAPRCACRKCSASPRRRGIGGGAIPVTFKLLSPAQRPLQVTRDLASFWRNAYVEVRKDMRGRYPRHYWPENPLEAEPTRRAPADLTAAGPGRDARTARGREDQPNCGPRPQRGWRRRRALPILRAGVAATTEGKPCSDSGTWTRRGGRCTTARPARGPAVVLLHWGPGTSAQYSAIVDEFAARGFRAIAPDLPGFGHSMRRQGHWSVGDFADNVARVPRGLGSRALRAARRPFRVAGGDGDGPAGAGAARAGGARRHAGLGRGAAARDPGEGDADADGAARGRRAPEGAVAAPAVGSADVAPARALRRRASPRSR